jgi:hypothetical protein
MKRFLLFLASRVALSMSGCGLRFEPGVGFYWNREVNYGWAREFDWTGAIIDTTLNSIDPKTEEEEQREFFGH